MFVESLFLFSVLDVALVITASPTIICPTIHSTHIADRGQTYATVRWGLPTIYNHWSSVRLKQSSGKGSGDQFERGFHSVAYTGTDADGLKDVCIFNFIVKVKTCRPMFYLRNGRVICNGHIYGKSCDFLCDDGYELRGTRTVTCQRNEQWSARNPECVAKKCVRLSIPRNAIGFSCTDANNYGSTCLLTCNEEDGYAPPRGQYTRCNENQEWSNFHMECEDIEPPTINNCPSQTLMQARDRSSDLTDVIWPAITATDNSQEKIIVRSAIGNISPTGGRLSEGTHLVTFTAEDDTGNIAEPCNFLVRVQAVVCDPPRLADDNLDTDCTNLMEGDSCYLKCHLALNLMGSIHITCRREARGGQHFKGYWDWGQSTDPDAVEPFCEVHKCNDLPSPQFGSMTCDKWYKGAFCQLQCQYGYDIPNTVFFPTSLYICSKETGNFDRTLVPDCERKEEGDALRFPEYYYFDGSCEAAKEEIKSNFLDAIYEADACPEEQYCTVANVNVKCGDEPEEDDFRWKRAAPNRRRTSGRRGSRRRPSGRRVPGIRRRSQRKKTTRPIHTL